MRSILQKKKSLERQKSRIRKVTFFESYNSINLKFMEELTGSKLSHSWIRLQGGQVQVNADGVGKGKYQELTGSCAQALRLCVYCVG